MLQAGIIIIEQYFLDGLFRRIKSDPSIKISVLLIDGCDLIRMTSTLALETLKHIALTVRLIQITAIRTGLRGVCGVDLLSTDLIQFDADALNRSHTSCVALIAFSALCFAARLP